MSTPTIKINVSWILNANSNESGFHDGIEKFYHELLDKNEAGNGTADYGTQRGHVLFENMQHAEAFLAGIRSIAEKNNVELIPSIENI